MDTDIIWSIQSAIENDSETQENFRAYDDIDSLKWGLPEGWETKDYIRKRVSTEGHDDLKSLANIFDTHNPKWEILPRGAADADNAEEQERWLEWHMKRANQIGEVSPFRQALHNAGKYNRVILQVDYLPYWLPKNKKKWTKEQKTAAMAGPFCIEVQNPRNVFYEMGKYGLKWAASVTLLYGQDIINHWSAYEGKGEEGKSIKSALSKIAAEIEEDDDRMYIHVDYTSHDKRQVAVFRGESLADFENFDGDSEHISIIDTENKLSFINWVIVSGDSDPLLHSMHIGGSWENQNLIETIVDSTVLRRAFFPILKHSSMMGTPMEITYDGTQDVIEQKQGEDTQVLMPPPIDPALRELMASNANRMGQSVGIKKLQGMEMAGNVQYSTMNAYIQMQMTALEPYKRTTEKAWEQAAKIMFMWLKETGDKVMAYRDRVNKSGQAKGMAITVGPEDFETEDLFISCELIANTPSDKMQMVNMYSSLKQAGAQIGWGELLERLGLGTPEVLKQDWMTEQMEGVALQNFIEQLKAQQQMQVQAQQMQMQQAMQQEQAVQQQAMQQQAQPPQQPQGDPVIPDGSLNDTSQGGMSTMQSAPGMTRNQVKGGQ